MKQVDIQNTILNQLRRQHIRTTVILANGARIVGYVKGFDNFVIQMSVENKTQLIYKHVISTIVPSREPKPEDESSDGDTNE